MKSLNLATALLVGAILVTTGSGCKKTIKSPTLIPGRNVTPIDPGSNPVGPVDLAANRTVPPGSTNTNDPNINTTGLRDPNLTTSTPLTPEQRNTVGARMDPANTIEDRTVLQAETVLFALDRATVTASEIPKVERVATFLKNETTANLLIEGHCDERGTEDYNRSLGERRALAIREVLVNSGVPPERVTTLTFGEDKPADPGHDDAAWTKNRRGDFVVLRPKTLQ